MKTIELVLGNTVSSGIASRLFKELGATLHYDVYSFQASENEDWQSESLLHVNLFYGGVEVFAQDDFNKIILSYPLALRPSSDQCKAIELTQKIIDTFHARAFYLNEEYLFHKVQEDWGRCNTYLLNEWAEEPGSFGLAKMVLENYT